MASKCLFMCAHRLHVSGFRKLTWKQVWRCFSSYMLEIFQVFLLVPGLYWSLFSLFYQCDLRQKWIKYARLYALCNIRTLYRSSWICQSCAVLNCCGPFSGKMPRILVRKTHEKGHICLDLLFLHSDHIWNDSLRTGLMVSNHFFFFYHTKLETIQLDWRNQTVNQPLTLNKSIMSRSFHLWT